MAVSAPPRPVTQPTPTTKIARRMLSPKSVTGRPADRLQLVPIQVSLAILVAMAAAIASLHVLFASQTWWIVVMLVVTLVLGAAAGTRSLTPRRWAPAAASIITLIVVQTLLFARSDAILGIIPFGPTFSKFVDLFADASLSIARQGIPANAVAAIVFVLCFGFGVIAILADAIGIAGRRPALVGVLLLVILAIPVVTRRDIADPLFFALTAAAYLVLLMAGRPRRKPGLAIAIGATSIVGALFAPSILPAIDFTASGDVPGVSTGVNPILRLGDDLRQQSSRSVITYSTSSGASHYLRLVTLENFTGKEWAPTPTETDRGNNVRRIGDAPGLDAQVVTTDETSEIAVGPLSSKWLPLPYPATRVSGTSNNWYWDAETLVATSPGNTSQNETYTVQSRVLQPTPAQLIAAGTGVAAGFEQYVDLPTDLPAIISTTATNVAGAAGTNYEKAIALQQYFRSNAFTYSEQAPVTGKYDGTGMDIIATFLDKRSGYCVHFASTMAVMARSLGIPSRVVVGFLPGSRTNIAGTAGYDVSSKDLHAWPELFFEGIGWVQFEPTPGRGAPASYADVAVAGVPAPAAPVGPAPGVTPSAAPSVAPSNSAIKGLESDQGATSASASVAIPWQLLVVLGVIVLGLVPAIIRSLQRQRLARRLRSGAASAVDAWIEVLRTAVDLGIRVSPTETPREAAQTIGAGGAALSLLVRAVELEGYAPAQHRELSGLWRAVRDVRAQLTQQASTRESLRATLIPSSLWRRIAHPLTVDPIVERTRTSVDA